VETAFDDDAVPPDESSVELAADCDAVSSPDTVDRDGEEL